MLALADSFSKNKKHRAVGDKAFTIVELLIVIVVIGILAGIVIVAYSGIRDRASSTAASQGLNSIYKGLLLWQTTQGSSTWPVVDEYGDIDGIPSDPEGDGAQNNPRVEWLIEKTSLKDYLNTMPKTGTGDAIWYYVNDGCDVGDGYCDAKDTWSGPIIYANDVPMKLMQGIDDSIDDGNLNTGTVRYDGGGTFVYKLSVGQTI